MFISINQAISASRARREQGEKGFTLIELLVVVLIIGVLSAIAIPIFLNQQKSAKIAAVESDLSSAKTAIVAQMVTDEDFDITAVDFAALEGFSISNGVTLTMAAGASTDAFCIDGTHADAPDAADQRHVSDTGGVKAGTCAVPIP